MDLPPPPLVLEPATTTRRRRRLTLGIVGLLAILLPALAALWLTQPGVRPLSGPAVPAVSEAALRAHVEKLATDFRPRDHRHPENLDRVATYVADLLRAAGGRVSEQAFQVGSHTYRNVIAAFGPAIGDPVVIGAHMDAYGDLPGADDNASGVAGLLELGRIFGTQPPAAPVLLVAFTLEEPPHFRTGNMGSVRHAQALRQQGTKVRAMLALEMIGTFSDAPGSQRFPLPIIGLLYPDQGNFIAVVGRLGDGRLTRRVKAAMAGATPLEVRSMNAPRSVVGIDFSDHRAYWDAGYPALMITDGAFFRNTAYHTPQDTPERLDYRRMGQVVQGVWAAVQELHR